MVSTISEGRFFSRSLAKQCDVDGHINELVSPGDCTDLCSTIDQEIGSFVKAHFNDSFSENFRADPDRWAKGKVPASERRRLFTVWVGDAVDALMQRRDIIRRAFRGTGVGIDIEGKEKSSLRFPGYDTYEGPDIDEEHNDQELSTAEIDAMQKREEKYQTAKKKRKLEEKDEAKRKRAILRINKI